MRMRPENKRAAVLIVYKVAHLLYVQLFYYWSERELSGRAHVRRRSDVGLPFGGMAWNWMCENFNCAAVNSGKI